MVGAVSACGKGDDKLIGSHDGLSLDGGSAGADGTTSTSGSDAGDPGEPSCAVGSVPADVDADPLYSKYTDALGMPVLASAEVPDLALTRACQVVNRMLAKRADIRAEMLRRGARVAVIAQTQALHDLPELTNLSSDWDATRGIGATVYQPLTVGTEENLLCYSADVHRGEVILVHSFAHAMRALGTARLEPDFDARLEALYDTAMFEGKWQNAFANESFPQYWAEGVQSWFNVNLAPPNMYHNEINTRAELADYDPRLYEFIAAYMPEADSILDCF
jgi:hypothetical protein